MVVHHVHNPVVNTEETLVFSTHVHTEYLLFEMKLQFRVFCNILQYVQCRKAGLDEICGMAVKTGTPLENGVSWPFLFGEASL